MIYIWRSFERQNKKKEKMFFELSKELTLDKKLHELCLKVFE